MRTKESQDLGIYTCSVQYVQWWCHLEMIENLNIDVYNNHFNTDVNIKNINQCPMTAENSGVYTHTV